MPFEWEKGGLSNPNTPEKVGKKDEEPNQKPVVIWNPIPGMTRPKEPAVTPAVPAPQQTVPLWVWVAITLLVGAVIVLLFK